MCNDPISPHPRVEAVAGFLRSAESAMRAAQAAKLPIDLRAALRDARHYIDMAETQLERSLHEGRGAQPE